MGSFANSIHLRCADANLVDDSVVQYLTAELYVETQKAPSGNDPFGVSDSLRGVRVSEPRHKWVSVLDSDLLGSMTLASELSRSLATHAIGVFVNDSDSWQYLLWFEGKDVDQFDSSATSGGSPEDIEAVLATGGFDGAMSAMKDHAERQQKKLDELTPQEIRRIQSRMEAGQATKDDMQEYLQWVTTEMPRIARRLDRQSGSAGTEHGRGAEDQNADLSHHLAALRPILQPDVHDETVLEILGRGNMIAELTLKEFLPLVGIPPLYAHLSYAYFEESTEEELTAESIEMAAHLTFEMPN